MFLSFVTALFCLFGLRLWFDSVKPQTFLSMPLYDTHKNLHTDTSNRNLCHVLLQKITNIILIATFTFCTLEHADELIPAHADTCMHGHTYSFKAMHVGTLYYPQTEIIESKVSKIMEFFLCQNSNCFVNRTRF